MNRNVLITGANGGIGRSLIIKFASKGFDIIAHMRSEKSEFFKFAEEITKKYGVSIQTVYFDLSDEDSVKSGIKELVSSKVKISVLINNAGIEHGGLLQMTSMKEIRKVFEINLFSAVQITQLVSRLMARNGGGSIVNIASIAGLDLGAGNVAYGTSKAALIAFTKTAAKELASQNIRVNAVAPGLTDTRMATMMESKAGEDMVSGTAFKRLARPEEIADTVYYLSSDKASFVTGQVLRVDGGM